MNDHEDLGDPWVIANRPHIDAGARNALGRSAHEVKELKQHINQQKEALRRKIAIAAVPAIIGICSFLAGPSDLTWYIAESVAILLPAAYLAMETNEYTSDKRRCNKKKSAHDSLARIAHQVKTPVADSGRPPLK